MHAEADVFWLGVLVHTVCVARWFSGWELFPHSGRWLCLGSVRRLRVLAVIMSILRPDSHTVCLLLCSLGDRLDLLSGVFPCLSLIACWDRLPAPSVTLNSNEPVYKIDECRGVGENQFYSFLPSASHLEAYPPSPVLACHSPLYIRSVRASL